MMRSLIAMNWTEHADQAVGSLGQRWEAPRRPFARRIIHHCLIGFAAVPGIKGEEAREIYERAYGVGTTVTFTVVAGHTNHYAMPVTLLADKMRD
jgi:hypothetical protein